MSEQHPCPNCERLQETNRALNRRAQVAEAAAITNVEQAAKRKWTPLHSLYHTRYTEAEKALQTLREALTGLEQEWRGVDKASASGYWAIGFEEGSKACAD